MEIEDTYGEFEELYYAIDDDESYIVILNGKECGFIEMLDGDIYVLDDECLKSIFSYSNYKMEVYEIEVSETYINLDIEQAINLKNKPSSKLIYKN